MVRIFETCISLTVFFAFFHNTVVMGQRVVTQVAEFESGRQSMWKDDGFSFDFEFEIFPEFGVDEQFSTEGITLFTFEGLKFGVVIEGEIGFGVGPMAFKIEGFTTGDVEVDYPAEINILLPNDSTFNQGEVIVINSDFRAGADAEIRTRYPNAGEISLGMDYRFNAGISAQACFIDCTPSFPIVPAFSIDTTLFIFKLNQDGLTHICNSLPDPSFQCVFDTGFPPWEITSGPFKGSFGIPNVMTTSAIAPGGKNLTANGEHEYAAASLNIIETLGFLPPPVGPVIKTLNGSRTLLKVKDVTGTEREVKVTWSIIGLDLIFPINHTQEFLFQPSIFTELFFPDTLEYIVYERGKSNNPKEGISVTYEVGDSVGIRFPCDYDFMNLKTEHTLYNRFSNKTFDNFQVQLDFEAFGFSVEIDEFVIVPRVCIPNPFGDDFCVGPIGFDAPDLIIPPLVNPPAWTLVSLNFPPYFEDEWSLPGFETFDKNPPFRITPRQRQVEFVTNDVTCFGDSTGSILASVIDGSEPIRYDWAYWGSTNNPTGLPGGPHYVTITDANDCISIERVDINQPPPIVSEITGDEILCFGDATATVSVTATGGNGGFDYLWNTMDIGGTLSNRPAGTYRVTITDSEGCVEIDSIVIAEPPLLVTGITNRVDPACNGDDDGSLDLFVEGGSPPYLYRWSNFAIAQNIENLPAGDYSVTVEDINGCTASDDATLSQPTAMFGNVQKVADVSCFAGEDGALAVTVQGGTPPYRYRWLDSLVTLSDAAPTINNLKAGDYTVQVLDTNNCRLVFEASIDEPEIPLQATIEEEFPSCDEGNDGALDLTTWGGTAPYRYQWSSGHTLEDISNLTAGVYEIRITDANNCIFRTKTLLIEPPPIQVEYTATEVTCADQQDATITIDEIIGGFPPYDILWSNSENGEMIEELEEGSYTFIITDDKGCTVQETVVVSLSPQPCLFIPNAFSPNGDTVNDVWNIRNIQLYPEVLIRVFNKWGEQVFESMGYAEAWDGTFRGNLLPPATYYYVLDLQNGDPIYKGALSILR